MEVQLLVMIALGDVQLHHKEAIRDLNQAKGGSTLEVCKLGRSSWSSRAPSLLDFLVSYLRTEATYDS